MRILAILISTIGITYLIMLSIAGLDNKEVDDTTQHMHINNCLLTDTKFLINFNNKFPHK